MNKAQKLKLCSITERKIKKRKLRDYMKVNREKLKKDLLLYAVTDRTWLNGESLLSQVEKGLQGGITFLQIREKDLNYRDFLEEAKALRELCSKYSIPFVVNDNAEIAKESGADGVHIGQEDMSLLQAREILGEDKIIGVSVQTVQQAKEAENMGADYLGVGAVFPTGSKSDAVDVPLDTLTEICSAVSIPVVAIGGIAKENVKLLKGCGICGIAVISAIFAQKDIEEATKELREKVENEIL